MVTLLIYPCTKQNKTKQEKKGLKTQLFTDFVNPIFVVSVVFAAVILVVVKSFEDVGIFVGICVGI